MKRSLVLLLLCFMVAVYSFSQIPPDQVAFSDAGSTGLLCGAIVIQPCPAYADSVVMSESHWGYVPNQNKQKALLPAGLLCELTNLTVTVGEPIGTPAIQDNQRSSSTYVRVTYYRNNHGGRKRYVWVEQKYLKFIKVEYSPKKGNQHPLIRQRSWVKEFVVAARQVAKELGIELYNGL